MHPRTGDRCGSYFPVWLADKLGVPGQKIIYNGVSKTKESLRSAIEKNILSINADSIEELKMLKRLAIEASKKVSVGIRLGLVDESQFGVDLKGGEAEEACKYILEHPRCFNLVNLHLHTVANARNSRSHRYYIKQALGFLLKIKTAYGIEVPYLDIGGGFGVPTSQLMPKFSYAFYRLFGILPKRPSGAAFQVFDDYIRDIVLFIKEFCSAHSLNMPKLIIEPGRVIASRAELLLSRVNSIKRKSNGRMYCMTDVGKFSTAYPCDYEYHDIFVANKLTRAPQELYHIVGRICMAGDFVFKNKLLPSLDSGDVLAIMDAGAYFSSYSSNFGFQRPAIVKVKDGNSQVIRHEETFEHLVSMDTLFGERSKP
jgi:diaminopimelate decarboxylase